MPDQKNIYHMIILLISLDDLGSLNHKSVLMNITQIIILISQIEETNYQTNIWHQQGLIGMAIQHEKFAPSGCYFNYPILRYDNYFKVVIFFKAL